MLIAQIERFLRTTKMSGSRFGRLAAHDPRFVEDLRNGREPRAAMTQRIEGFMSGYLAANARQASSGSPLTPSQSVTKEIAHAR